MLALGLLGTKRDNDLILGSAVGEDEGLLVEG